MERIRNLIEKLNTQFSNNTSLEQLLSTVQLLQNELVGGIKEMNILGTSGVSVIVPNAKPLASTNISKIPEKEHSTEKEYFELILPDVTEEEQMLDVVREIPSYEELMKLQTMLKQEDKTQATLSFKETPEDSSEEMPTLSRQNKPASKAAKQASAPKVNRNTIKDLYKAISAHDKITFVKELFRGDEVMFERSIKTINSFTTFAHADYWIQRELRTKNGWLTGNPIVQQFEQLVKRRFS